MAVLFDGGTKLLVFGLKGVITAREPFDFALKIFNFLGISFHLFLDALADATLSFAIISALALELVGGHSGH